MKHDAKNTKPLKGSPSNCWISPNRYIPECKYNDDDILLSPNKDTSNENNNTNKEGRQVVYQTKIICTPVMSSERLAQKGASAGTVLCAHDVHELNETFKQLSIDASKEAKEEQRKLDQKLKNTGCSDNYNKQEELLPSKAKESVNKNSESFFGRFLKLVRIGGKNVEVKRSCRLAGV